MSPLFSNKKYLTRFYLFQIISITVFSLLFIPSADAQPILVLNTVGQPPLNTPNHTGFMDEVTREAMRRIGRELVINRLPAERALHSANTGLIDGEMSRIKILNKTYTNLIRVPEKIMDWEFVIFSKKKINLKKSWSSLKEKDVAFITGWKILEKNISKAAKITKVKNSQQLFLLLKKDRVDYVAYEKWGGRYLISKLRLNRVKLKHPALAKKEMFIFLHKKHAKLVPELSRALTNMKKDGSYQRLVKKHLTVLLE